MSITISEIVLQGALLGEENPLPVFRDNEWHRSLGDAGLLSCEKEGFGYMTGKRVLPCKIQDGYTREKSPMRIKTVILENAYLKATFLPEYGGRLYSLYDKERGKELLSVNPVFQPCNLAVRNAWFSGGIEWNLGQYGHGSLTCAPMFFARVKDGDYEYLRMYEFERIKSFFLQIDFHLPEDSRVLLAHIKIYNSNDTPDSLYWWTNIAVELKAGMRVLSGTPQVISCLPNGGKFDTFKHEVLPELSEIPSLDATFPGAFPYSTEYFFQNEPAYEQAWEAAAYEDGSVFFERSTPEMPYRKLFCWSSKRGGKHWQEFLSSKGETPYLEIQSGPYRTQVHGGDVPERFTFSVTQAFGGLNADASMTHDIDFTKASDGVYKLIDAKISREKLQDLNTRFKELSLKPCGEILHNGSGWAALEGKLAHGIIPPQLRFGDDTMGAEQAPWLELIRTGRLPAPKDGLPLSYQCNKRWLALMRSVVLCNTENETEILLHYGIACYENGLIDEAQRALDGAYTVEKTPIVCYAMAQLKRAKGDMDKAVYYSREMINGCEPERSGVFAKEHIILLTEAELYEEVWSFYQGLDTDLQEGEALRRAVMPAAYELGQLSFLEEQFHSEFPTIREGEQDMTELWYKVRAKEYAEEAGTEFDEALSYVKTHMEPPYEIDFQTFSEMGEIK